MAAPKVSFSSDELHGKERAYVGNRLPAVNQGLRLLRPHEETDEEIAARLAKERRLPYQVMQVHMERAAHALAVGGNYKIAARYAGVSVRQVKKYWSQAIFRQRVAELQQTLLGKIRGKVLREIDRRTSPEMIAKMELMDLLRVGDRTGLGRGENLVEAPESGKSNYDLILQQIFVNDSPEKGSDFPIYRDDDIRVPSQDPPE